MACVQELSALDDICQIYKLWQLIIKSTFQRGTENGIKALLVLWGYIRKACQVKLEG